MNTLAIALKFIKRHSLLLATLAIPCLIFIFTLGKYYGIYYDNHYFHLLGMGLLENFRVFLYLGSHYTVHSSLYSYLLYPVFFLFGPSDLTMESVSAVFHLLSILLCFKLGSRIFSRACGYVFAALFAVAPFFLINIYTVNEYSLTVFLNLAGTYYFLSAFAENSRRKMVFAALIYALSCFHTIYALLSLPFFTLYSLAQLFRARGADLPAEDQPLFWMKSKFLKFAAVFLLGIAYLYLFLLLREMFIRENQIICYLLLACFIFLSAVVWKFLNGQVKERIKFCSLFTVVAVGALLLLDLFVQLDINLLHGYFGYWKDTSYVGGFGSGRPFFYFAGRAIKIFGKDIYFSVLSSLLCFTNSYTRGSLDLHAISKIMFSFYKNCFPPAVNIFFLIGVLGLSIEFVAGVYRKSRLGMKVIFPLVWLLATIAVFVNTEPLNVRRVALVPMPYLLAGLGICFSGNALGAALSKAGRIKNIKRAVSIITAGIACVVTFLQLGFLKAKVFDRYKYNDDYSGFYHLFHNWPYGRTYKEAGDFLLADAPLKKDGKFRSIVISIIPPNWFYGNIEWYTRDKIKVIYDLRYAAYVNYGTKTALAKYLNGAFSGDPDIQEVYFLDLVDPKGENTFFSNIHPDILPYRLLNEGDSANYDCVLFKFERGTWQRQLGVSLK
ncbi:MAG: glycosyltransferase family 39 protein [Candidatus Omnitrophota bacterium]|nr:glycosyltransferase family 39 protein [Candidatus Omnitrophota bacterium]